MPYIFIYSSKLIEIGREKKRKEKKKPALKA